MPAILKQALFIVLWIGLFLEILLDTSLRSALETGLAHYPALAPLILVGLQIVLASFVLPCGPVTMLAGVLWGFWFGVLYSLGATVVASLWTFLLGRYVLREWLHRQAQRDWQRKVLELIDRYSWKASMLAHANPVFPGSSLGYVFGASNVSLGSFAVGALLGILPLQLMLVGLGHLTKNSLVEGVHVKGIISLAAICVLIVLYRRLAPKTLARRRAASLRGGQEE